MKNTCYIIYYILIYSVNGYSQNLISNSSFSEVTAKQDSNSFYRILPNNSNVKKWYLPDYINYRSATAGSKSPLYSSVLYSTSRDKDLVIKKKSHLVDQFFENNLGYIYMFIDNTHTVSFIQQHIDSLISKGKYCFKFKYKYIADNSLYKGKAKLEFSFSKTNLKEFYFKQRLTVPDSLIQGVFKDSVKVKSGNSPWEQKCYIVNLKGNEQFLTIGSLSNADKYNLDWALYYIDDVELYPLSDMGKCDCEIINKDLRSLYTREFSFNEHISNDTLVMFTPNGRIAPGTITPPAKYYLNNIIAFMQRNPKTKITFIQHNWFSDTNIKPTQTHYYINYLIYYGIDKNRISERSGLCEDQQSIYCGHGAEYVKIGFELHKE